MNTCGTCKHFGPPVDNYSLRADDDEGEPSKYHACQVVKFFARPGNRDPKPEAPAVVVDGSGYYAALCVKEEFGCNQWAAA